MVSDSQPAEPADPPSETAPALGNSSIAAIVISWIAAGVMFAFAAALVVGGEMTPRTSMEDGKYGPHFEVGFELNYGRPLCFLRRDASEWDQTTGQPVWSNREFRLGACVVDLLLGATLFAGGLASIWWWRRSRQHWLQIYLSEILLLTTLVACAAAWLAWNHQAHAAEEEIVRQLVSTQPECAPFVTWHPGGWWWLRQLLGDRWFAGFDRVVKMGVDRSRIEKLRGLRSLRSVKMWGAPLIAELAPLSELPELEGLDCSFSLRTDKDEFSLVTEPDELALFPPLPRLRGLNAYNVDIRLHPDFGERLPQLEVIYLGAVDKFDRKEPTIEALIRMKQLRKIWAGMHAISEAGHARLRKALPHCEINGEIAEP